MDGPWLLISEAQGALRDAKGAIINISSHAGVRPKGANIPYACSKAALNHMTKLLAKTLAPDIRINAVAPGLVNTPMSEDWHDIRKAWRQQAPMQREAEAEDIAKLVVTLLQNTYLTGEVILMDGGLNLT